MRCARQTRLMGEESFAAQRAHMVRRGRHAAEVEVLRDLAQGRRDTLIGLLRTDEVHHFLLSERQLCRGGHDAIVGD